MRSDRSGDFTCWRDRQNQATCLWVIRQTLDSVGKEAQSKSDQVYQPPYLCPQQVAAGDWVLVEDSQTAWALPAASVPACYYYYGLQPSALRPWADNPEAGLSTP